MTLKKKPCDGSFLEVRTTPKLQPKHVPCRGICSWQKSPNAAQVRWNFIPTLLLGDTKMLVSLAKQAAAVAVAMLAMVASIQACKNGHLPSGS